MGVNDSLTLVFKCVGITANELTLKELEIMAHAEAALHAKRIHFDKAFSPQDSQSIQNRGIAKREVSDDAFIEERRELQDGGGAEIFRDRVLMRQSDEAHAILCVSYREVIASMIFNSTAKGIISPLEYEDPQKFLRQVHLNTGEILIVRFPQSH